jgi:hypothetical protein
MIIPANKKSGHPRPLLYDRQKPVGGEIPIPACHAELECLRHKEERIIVYRKTVFLPIFTLPDRSFSQPGRLKQ